MTYETYEVRKVAILALAIYKLEVVLTQSNSLTHQALVVELFRGGEVALTGMICDYQCGATVQKVGHILTAHTIFRPSLSVIL